MTALTLDAHTAPGSRAHSGHGPVFLDVLRSEWTKLRSVRSTYWTLLGALLASIGMSALVSAVVSNSYHSMSAVDKAHLDPTSLSMSGLSITQFAIGVLAVLLITGEYSTGAIRSTFAAVPQRHLVLGAKAAVFGAVALVVGAVCTFGAFFTGQAIMSSQGIQAHIGDPGVLRAVAGSAVYLAVLGLFALGIGTLLRRSAGAISTLFGILLVLPILVQALPASWSSSFSKYLPSAAGQAISNTVTAGPGARPSLSPGAGLGVFCLYAAITLVIAGVVLKRRDA